MTVTTLISLNSVENSEIESRFGFHCTAPHKAGEPVVVTGCDGSELWVGVIVYISGRADGSYTGVAVVKRTDKPIPKKVIDDGDPVPVTVTVGDEPGSPIEPVVVILDP